MAWLPRTAALVGLLLTAGSAPAAGQKDVDAAILKGKDYLKGRFKTGAATDNGIGGVALAGLALLEAKTPAGDEAIKAIAAAVREAAYKETKTYSVALCLLFLDRLENPADVPLIQMLAARLVAGQNAKGGWSYECVDAVPEADEKLLRAGLKEQQLVGGSGPAAPVKSPDPGPRPTAGRLHPVVEKYTAALWNRRGADKGDDNSNTQFAIIAVWASRKHGFPADHALDLIEKRFLASQNPRDGGWSYSTGAESTSTASMTCAGLIGLSVGVARREERRLNAEVVKPAPTGPKAADPFFNPPPDPTRPPPAPKRPADGRDVAVGAGLGCLGAFVTGRVGTENNLYFMWSLERVGVIYGIDKVGGVDWFAAGADFLVRGQQADGSWAGASYGADVNTCFALLFLTRSNLARDLSSKVSKDPAATELRAGGGPNAAPPPATTATPTPAPVANPLPVPAEDTAAVFARELVKMPAAEWAAALGRVRDAKGPEYTRVLVAVTHRADGGRKKDARDALAERLTRMSAESLRGMTTADDVELRRGAVLACAMKDDKAHVPDLIDRLADADDLVVRAARAGLKSLTAQDFGPTPGATKDERTAATAAWKAWWAKQK